MADSREPPPLFDDDDSRKDDENDDLFTSAVQSPVSEGGSLTPTVEEDVEKPGEQTDPLSDSPPEAAAHSTIQAQPSDSTSSPLFSQSPSLPRADTPPMTSEPVDLFESCSLGGNDSEDVTPTAVGPMTAGQEQVSTMSDPFFDDDIPDDPTLLMGSLVAPPPTPQQDLTSPALAPALHDETSCVLDSTTDLDTTIKAEKEVDLVPSVSASALEPVDMEEPTDDASNVVETEALPQNSSPGNPPVFLDDIDTSEIPLGNEPEEVSLDDNDDTGIFQSTAAPKLQLNQNDNEKKDEFIEITVTDPQKIGDGMGAYMAYKVTTKTNISYFRKQHWSVMRRFSDFLGLHSKLVEKHLHSGRIVPPAPQKSAIGTTKIKLGSDKSAESSIEFIEKRRAALERYMNRTAAHPTLRGDPDFREFVELDAELPRATQTSALSSAGVLRLFNRVGETVNKMTFKMDESDQWFEEKTQQIESLDNQLHKLHASLEGLVNYRRELAISTAIFAKSVAVLSSVEEHSALSRALHQLSEAEERIHTIHNAQADADYFHMAETTKDYIALIAAVKDVFHERVKAFQMWQHSQQMLAKKREAKAKAELVAKPDKIQQAQAEVTEWETKVERSQEEFERISKAIKKEIDQFEIIRVKDFKETLVKYLEALMTSQQQIIKVWETFIPEAKAIV
ncbi:sorting nexin 1 isoform X2 [Oratosquilla oratoria]|uniref:sorting nexin 1 isoform X2 n=1 Tax=Oratosquilla oratoria TaxID=337810 RepID=UPI003F768FE0